MGADQRFLCCSKEKLGTILEFFQYIQLTVLLDELEDDDDMCIKFSQIEGFVVFNDKSMHGT